MEILNLSAEERDKIRSGLTDDQLEFIDYYVKRGKRTQFAREMACSKGIYITDSMSDDEIEDLIDDWVLIDYKDAGPNWRSDELRCHCGAQLRYQYIVQHKQNNEILKFSKEHLQLHTGIDAATTKLILEGFNAIDFELDEILIKIRDKWSLQKEFDLIPSDFIIPEEFQNYLNQGIPLLDRQIQRLKMLIRSHLDGIARREVAAAAAPSVLIQERKAAHQSEFNFDIFSFTDSGIQRSTHGLELTPVEISAINQLIDTGKNSARAICEFLIRQNVISEERYSTGKPRMYPRVCLYLNSLVEEGWLRLISSNSEDRIYQKV